MFILLKKKPQHASSSSCVFIVVVVRKFVGGSAAMLESKIVCTRTQSSITHRGIARTLPPLAIPHLLRELNWLVFGYYGFLEHAFFSGDNDHIDLIVSLFGSGVGILANTMLLWEKQHNPTPFAKLIELCPNQVSQSFRVARNAKYLIDDVEKLNHPENHDNLIV